MSERVSLTADQRQAVEAFRKRHRTGVLTLLFTDMIGSRALKRELGDAAGVALIEQHQAVVRDLLVQCPEANEISTAGDSFFVVFTRPSDAVRYALLLHSRLRALSEETAKPVAVRIGIHMGEVFIQTDRDSHIRDILGFQVDWAHSIMEMASGGQTLMSRSVFDNARAILHSADIADLHPLWWLNHGPYRNKDLDEPFDVCEVGEESFAPLSPPADTDKAHRHVSPDAEPVLGWRPAVEQTVPGTEWMLEEKLGEGGFGEVWLARHKSMGDRRVFKFCFRADRVRSLKREVTLFRLLKEKVGEHPNIVRIHDVYFGEPPYYIETEYVAGKNLAAWCEEQGGAGKIPKETQITIIAQVADALQAAHESGVIHRDIKPSNILIGGEGTSPDDVRVKLGDFGIGQVVSRDLLAGAVGTGLTETIGGTELASRSGTRIYMAPEVLAGQRSSNRSDIYSLGVVLYQMAIGDFGRPLTVDWRDNVDDPALAATLAHCFAGEPLARFTSAAELADDLRTLESRRGDFAAMESTAPPLPAIRSDARLSRMAVAGAVVAMVFIPLLLVFCVMLFSVTATRTGPGGTGGGPGGPSPHSIVGSILFVSFLAACAMIPFATTVLGVVAIIQIRQSAGRLYGLGLALFDALLYPLLLLDIGIGVFWFFAGRSIGGTQIGGADLYIGYGPLIMLTVATCVVVDFFIVRGLWRSQRRAMGIVSTGAGDPEEALRRKGVLGAVGLAISLAGFGMALLAYGTSGPAAIMTLLWFVSQVAALIVGSLAFEHRLGKAAVLVAAVLLVVVVLLVAVGMLL